MGPEPARQKGLWRPLGEVQICLILANGAIIGHILDWKGKEQFFGVFRYWPGHRKRKRSPYRAYFFVRALSFLTDLFLISLINKLVLDSPPKVKIWIVKISVTISLQFKKSREKSNYILLLNRDYVIY